VGLRLGAGISAPGVEEDHAVVAYDKVGEHGLDPRFRTAGLAGRPDEIAQIESADRSRHLTSFRLLDELDKDTASALGVDEVDSGATRSGPCSLVEQLKTAFPQGLGDLVHVVDGVRDLVDAFAAGFEELGDRRLLGQWRDELQERAGLTHAQHRFADVLIVIDLGMDRLHAEGLGVERDGGIEVANRDPYVVDAA